MSLERMRILLGLEIVGNRQLSPQRQQIIPDIKLTCDGLITKWILGANWEGNKNLYPELQVWRSFGNGLFRKMNGTLINITMQSSTRIYEYDNFSPIPFLAGDILGAFLPQTESSKLILWSEKDIGPAVYYTSTGSATESPVDAIDLQHMPSLSSASYLPLVTVEISKVSKLPHTSSKSPESTPQRPRATGEDSSAFNNASLFYGVGVTGTLLVLIIAAVISVTVLVCLKKKSKFSVRDNVAYMHSTIEVELPPTEAYTATGDHRLSSYDHEYVYISTSLTASQRVNPASSIKATNIPTVTDKTCDIPTSTNVAYAIPISTNPAYAASVTPSNNQPDQCQSWSQ